VTFILLRRRQTHARFFHLNTSWFYAATHDVDDDSTDAMCAKRLALNSLSMMISGCSFSTWIIAHVNQLPPKHPGLVVARKPSLKRSTVRFRAFSYAQFVLVEAKDPIRELRLERRKCTNQPLRTGLHPQDDRPV